MKFLSGIIIFLIFSAWAKVEAPNYNFSLDALGVFHPGKTIQEIEGKYGKGEVYSKLGQVTVYQFYVAHIRYKFPVFVQIYNDKSLDFYAKLPSYFLHDIFHQSLINRYGKQDKFKKVDNHSVYIWKNKENFLHIYQGGCTITCFPVFYAGMITEAPQDLAQYKPLIYQFVDSHELLPLVQEK